MRSYVFVAAMLLAACSGPKNEQRPTENGTNGGIQAATAAPMCPAAVPGTAVRTENTADGVAMIFTNDDPAKVAQLQSSANQMAQSLAARAPAGEGGEVRTGMPSDEGETMAPETPPQGGPGAMDGTMQGDTGDTTGSPGTGMPPGAGGPPYGPGMHHRMQGWENLPPSQIEATSIENGARVEFRPVDPTHLDQLRAEVQRHAQAMQSGTCPMMRGATPPAG